MAAMSTSQIRKELLREHDELRAMITQTRTAVSSGTHDELRACLARLTEAFRRHNARESELLADLLQTIDAWGPERVTVMLDSHQAEHGELLNTLVEAGATTDREKAGKVTLKLLDALASHMKIEEKIMLGEDVLHDDVLARDYFGA